MACWTCPITSCNLHPNTSDLCPRNPQNVKHRQTLLSATICVHATIMFNLIRVENCMIFNLKWPFQASLPNAWSKSTSTLATLSTGLPLPLPINANQVSLVLHFFTLSTPLSPPLPTLQHQTYNTTFFQTADPPTQASTKLISLLCDNLMMHLKYVQTSSSAKLLERNLPTSVNCTFSPFCNESMIVRTVKQSLHLLYSYSSFQLHQSRIS